MNDLAYYKLRPHLSASSVNDYIDCGLLYRLSRIDRIPPEFKTDSLEFGSTIHFVLTGFYKEKKLGNRLLLKDIQESFEGFWEEMAQDNPEIRYSEGEDFDTLLKKGRELLAVWHSKLPENDFRVIGVEEPFALIRRDLSVPIIGYIDLLEEDEAGTIVVTDFKTSGRSYSADEVNKNLQLTIYQIAIRENGFRNREILLKLDCLVKTKTPKFEQFYTSRSEIEERRTIKKVQEVWRGMKEGIFIPNDGHWRCQNCGYKKKCDEFLEDGLAEDCNHSNRPAQNLTLSGGNGERKKVESGKP